MKVYNYDTKSNEYIGESLAPSSPLENGKHILPAYSTIEKPLNAKENQKNVYDAEEGKWILKPDHRGKVYYNKSTKVKIEITVLGVEPIDDLTDLKPENDFDVWDADKNKWIIDKDAKKIKEDKEKADKAKKDLIDSLNEMFLIEKNKKEIELWQIVRSNNGLSNDQIGEIDKIISELEA